MKDLHPTMWRTCRILANEKRLELLWRLFQGGEMSVSKLGESVGMAEPAASACLRAVNSRGLILSRRDGKYVFYRAEANPEVAGSEQLLDALKQAYEDFMPVPAVLKHFTAFTHERRISVVKILSEGPLGIIPLSIKAQISVQALYRHIRKLEARGYVARGGDEISLLAQRHALPAELVRQAQGS